MVLVICGVKRISECWTRGYAPCHRRINCVGSPAGEPPRGSGAAPVKTGGGNRALEHTRLYFVVKCNNLPVARP